jgi:hypothetical protein
MSKCFDKKILSAEIENWRKNDPTNLIYFFTSLPTGQIVVQQKDTKIISCTFRLPPKVASRSKSDGKKSRKMPERKGFAVVFNQFLARYGDGAQALELAYEYWTSLPLSTLHR